MEETRKGGLKKIESIKEAEADKGWTPICKATNRNRVQCPKPAGGTDVFLVGKDNPSTSPFGMCTSLSEQSQYFTKGKSSCVSNQGTEKKLQPPPEKIKLQLFPINDSTRLGLEKAGYNPHLELKLSAHKKISSVLKHIDSKWSGSSVAVGGKPFLIPYYLSKGSVSQRWMMNDAGISAGDVYEAIGSPPVFRLRYGWLLDAEAKSFEVPSALASSEACLLREGREQDNTGCKEKTCGKKRKIHEGNEEVEPLILNGAAIGDVADKPSPNGSAEALGEAAEIAGGTEKLTVPWYDSVSNLSVGGLLSEISSQEQLDNSDPKSNGINACLQPSQLVADSFDAFIAAQLSHFQGPRPDPPGSVSSILDAENTCHAFSFQKLSSVREDPLALGGSSPRSEDVHSELRNQKTEINDQCSGQQEGHVIQNSENEKENELSGSYHLGCQDSETDVLLCRPVCNDESTLGLSGIKWSDSLDPFGFGVLPSNRTV